MPRLFVCLILFCGFADPVMASECSLGSRDKSDKSLVYHTAAGAGLLLVWQASELTKSEILPTTPRWTDETINGFDQLGESLRWSPGTLDEAAASLSDNTLFLTALGSPVIAFLGESKRACIYEDLLFFEETLATAMVLNQAAKFIARRERPFARDLSEEERQELCQSRRECVDLNLSFYSGHASMTFVAAVAAGTIARQRGYESAAAAYSIGLLGAGLTAYLRVAAGKHYLSDVTLGAIMGAGVGYVMPKYVLPIMKRQQNIDVALMPQLETNLQGISLMGSW